MKFSPFWAISRRCCVTFCQKLLWRVQHKETPSLPLVSLLGDTTNIGWFFNETLGLCIFPSFTHLQECNIFFGGPRKICKGSKKKEKKIWGGGEGGRTSERPGTDHCDLRANERSLKQLRLFVSYISLCLGPGNIIIESRLPWVQCTANNGTECPLYWSLLPPKKWKIKER